jgi:hypothetical protein
MDRDERRSAEDRADLASGVGHRGGGAHIANGIARPTTPNSLRAISPTPVGEQLPRAEDCRYRSGIGPSPTGSLTGAAVAKAGSPDTPP